MCVFFWLFSGGNDYYRELNEQDYDMMLDDTPRGEYISEYFCVCAKMTCIGPPLLDYDKTFSQTFSRGTFHFFFFFFPNHEDRAYFPTFANAGRRGRHLTSFFLFADEVERLLRDYKQNQDFIRNLGNRFYQIIYPIQVRQREKFGVSTREIEGAYGKVSVKKSFLISLPPSLEMIVSRKKMTFDKKIRIRVECKDHRDSR